MRERLGDRPQWESSGAQRGRCWVYFGMIVRLPSGKLQHAFKPNSLYLSSLRSELSAPRRLCCHFRGLWSQNAWSIPCHQPQKNSHKHHFNPNVSLFSTEAIFQGMNEQASYTALYQQISFRECFFLQKCSFVHPLHSRLSQHTSPLLNNSGLP